MQLSDQLASFMETRFKRRLHQITNKAGNAPEVKYPTSVSVDLLAECIQIVDVLVTAFTNSSKYFRTPPLAGGLIAGKSISHGTLTATMTG